MQKVLESPGKPREMSCTNPDWLAYTGTTAELDTETRAIDEINVTC